MRKRLLALCLAAALVAACGSDSKPAATTASSSAAPKKLTKIVSLSATATEMLFAIGAGPQVIAVDDQSNYPPEAPMTDLSGYTPNVEAIVGYHPDLVVIANDTAGLVAGLENVKIKVLILPAATQLTDSYEQIETLGAETGHPDEAAKVVKDMKSDIDAAVKQVPPDKAGQTYYYELDTTYFTATSTTFIGAVLNLTGLKNIADAIDDGTGYPQLSVEKIVADSPEYIFLADTKCCQQTKESVSQRHRLVDHHRGAEGPDRRAGRRHRVTMGSTHRGSSPNRGGGPERMSVDRVRGTTLRPGVLLGAVIAVVVVSMLGLTIGPTSINPFDALREVASHLPFLDIQSPLPPAEAAIVWDLRFPRVVLALLVGGLLALCGGSYQGVFRNPLADPYLLGVAAGAGFGATLAIVAGYHSGSGASSDLIPLAAFAGALLAVALTYAVGASGDSRRSSASLLLAGVAITSLLTAMQTFVQQRETDTIREVYSWILGRLTTAGWHDVMLVLPYAIVSAVVLLAYRRTLDVLSVGDDEANTLGLHTTRVRLVVVVAASLGTAAAVSVSGLIGFVGIIVPHTIRLLGGASYRVILPLSLLLGGAFLVGADIIARTALAPAEVPIGVVTAFFGAPFFVVVLRTRRVVVT